MAHRLEALLRPGEAVVYQDLPDRRLFWVVLGLMAVLIVVWSAYAWIADLPFGQPLFFIAYTLGVALAAMLFQQSFGAGAAVVTDRRLLLDRGPMAALWGWQRIHDMPHGEIANVTRVGRGWLATLTLVLADGQQMSIENISKKERLAEALNAVTGAGPARDAPGA